MFHCVLIWLTCELVWFVISQVSCAQYSSSEVPHNLMSHACFFISCLVKTQAFLLHSPRSLASLRISIQPSTILQIQDNFDWILQKCNSGTWCSTFLFMLFTKLYIFTCSTFPPQNAQYEVHIHMGCFITNVFQRKKLTIKISQIYQYINYGSLRME